MEVCPVCRGYMRWHSENNGEMVFSCPVCGYEGRRMKMKSMSEEEKKKPCDDCVDYDDWQGGCKWCKEHEYRLHRTNALFPTPVVTNYDQIINKTPEEIAEWLADILNHCENKKPEELCRMSCPLYKCCNDQPSDSIEDWLKSPADKEKTE